MSLTMVEAKQERYIRFSKRTEFGRFIKAKMVVGNKVWTASLLPDDHAAIVSPKFGCPVWRIMLHITNSKENNSSTS